MVFEDRDITYKLIYCRFQCMELQCYIHPLSLILNGLRSGRYRERKSVISSFFFLFLPFSVFVFRKISVDLHSLTRPFLTWANVFHNLSLSVSLCSCLSHSHVSEKKTIDWIDNVPLCMEYVSLRSENEMSETCIVVGLSSNHKYFLCVCPSFIMGACFGWRFSEKLCCLKKKNNI